MQNEEAKLLWSSWGGLEKNLNCFFEFSLGFIFHLHLTAGSHPAGIWTVPHNLSWVEYIQLVLETRRARVLMIGPKLADIVNPEVSLGLNPIDSFELIIHQKGQNLKHHVHPTKKSKMKIYVINLKVIHKKWVIWENCDASMHLCAN